MGKVLDALLGKADTLDEDEFEVFDYRNENLKTGGDVVIQTAHIQSKSDMLETEEALRSGDIVITKVGPLKSGLTRDNLSDFLNNAANDVDGDIVWRNESELIITPRGVSVSRKSLTK